MPPGDLSLEVLREPDGVADQRHPLGGPLPAPASAQLLGLLQREHGLAAAGATAHLDPPQQSGHLEQQRLLLGESVRGRGSLGRLGVHVVRRVAAPGEDLDDEVDVVVVGGGVVVGEAPTVVADSFREAVLLAAVVQRPTRELRHREVVAELRVRGHHPMGPGDVASTPPPRVGLHVAADRVLGVTRLVDGVAAIRALTALDPPTRLVVPDAAALDLEDQDAELGHQHDQVGFVVLDLIGEADVGHQDVVGTEGVAQALPDFAFGGGGEGRVLRDEPGHGVWSSSSG